MILGLLRNYHRLADPDITGDLLDLRLDLERALAANILTYDEKMAISALYFDDPQVTTERTGQSGRPRGGLQMEVAAKLWPDKSLNAAKIELTRTLDVACHKLAMYLGEGYLD